MRHWLASALACALAFACSTSQPSADAAKAEPVKAERAPSSRAQATPPPPPATSATPAAGAEASGDRTLTAAELEQLVAPIALYPDDLIAQILMASTYPLEIVEAARWAKDPAHAKLKGKALEEALDKQSWDMSVKSLVPFPTVLENMDQKLDWTQKLGDAVLAQQKDVMDAIQRLRVKADAAGNLKSNDKQAVTTETDPATQQQVIIIQPTNPEVVYVPTYQPTVVYGAWGYPGYPPYYWPPPAGAVFVAGFFWGAAIAAGGYYGWGHCGWHGGDVDINRNTNINVDRGDRPDRGDRERPSQGDRGDRGDRGGRGDGAGSKWKHDSSHRKGVNYADAGTREKYGKGQSRDAAARDQFRGRDGAGPGERSSVGSRDRAGASAGSRDVGRSAGQRGGGGGTGAFDRAGGGSGARASSSRGNSSFGGGSRGSYGGGRGGGGRGGGGRGGGRR